MTPFAATYFYRGTTVYFSSTFYDVNGAVVQPSGAAINLSYIEDGQVRSTLVEMTPPVSPAVAWTAQWDTRLIQPGVVNWSVHSETPTLPYGVGDGSFTLLANNANLPTF